MKEEFTIKDHTEWHGEYKGVQWEIVKWKGYDRYIWNYYIYVKPRKKKYTNYKIIGIDEKNINYYDMYGDVYMHGEITFMCEILYSYRLRKLHKIGCDFNHLYDQDIEYSFDDVKSEVVKCIDTLPKDLIK